MVTNAIPMEPVSIVKSPVYFQDTAFEALKALIADRGYSAVFVLVDNNTAAHCIPFFKRYMGQGFSFVQMQIPAGEVNKNMEQCMRLWQQMSDSGGDRKSVLINLGGGVVTDLGGMVASIFKRGIDYINIPTSLLAMVDAAIGGKTGVDLGILKNQLGVINHPEMVVVHTGFLNTLPGRHMNNGKAEMWKHGLIRDREYWVSLKEDQHLENLAPLIRKSVMIKGDIVNRDPTEQGLRKVLNFGHTLGHAIESYFLNQDQSLLHGEAIAAGMIMETQLSTTYCNLDPQTALEICNVLLESYPKVVLDKKAVPAIISLLKHDKKNEKGQLKFVLLKGLGDAEFDIEVSRESIEEAIAYYRDF